uniref:Uncharacterized protein n=1 Tax=Anguilla anguilla TaxID=7936 RepID=A0A0E9SUN6_ANGAN
MNCNNRRKKNGHPQFRPRSQAGSVTEVNIPAASSLLRLQCCRNNIHGRAS